MAFLPKLVNLTVDAVQFSFYRGYVNDVTRKIEKQAQGLSPEERAQLAMSLIESLDQGHDEDVEKLWLDEAERRLDDYRSGRIEAIPANEVFERIEKKLG